ncbi:hypothetical protein D5R81_08950 [Parashewanella spongiae]|uniref:Uncharacterized protein n=2 Tax=Parashewanella spongiae TaxID=342950 RepID=A0A3A6U500_9GAMM|nr:hypothetical protein [Parashewanella spongiae]MCL1078098.1 hypothetical protein [Parashewanella spongiae]RJY16468.1 hypothetical protein D5R81_08950 [Parashewanella spongiae]
MAVGQRGVLRSDEITGTQKLANLSVSHDVQVRTNKTSLAAHDYGVSITSDDIVEIYRQYFKSPISGKMIIGDKVGPTATGGQHQTSQLVRNTVLVGNEISPRVAAKNIMKSDELAKTVLSESSAQRAADILVEIAKIEEPQKPSELTIHKHKWAEILLKIAQSKQDHVVAVLNKLPDDNRNAVLGHSWRHLTTLDIGKTEESELLSCIVLKMAPDKSAQFLKQCTGDQVYAILQCGRMETFSKAHELDFVNVSASDGFNVLTVDCLKGATSYRESMASKACTSILAIMGDELDDKINKLQNEQQKAIREIASYKYEQNLNVELGGTTEENQKEEQGALSVSIGSFYVITDETDGEVPTNFHQDSASLRAVVNSTSSDQNRGYVLRPGITIATIDPTAALRTTSTDYEGDNVSFASYSTDDEFDEWIGGTHTLLTEQSLLRNTSLNEHRKSLLTKSVNQSLRPVGNFEVIRSVDKRIHTTSVLPAASYSSAIKTMKKANEMDTLKKEKTQQSLQAQETISDLDTAMDFEESIDMPKLVVETLELGLSEREYKNMTNRLGDFLLAVAHSCQRRKAEIEYEIQSWEEQKAQLETASNINQQVVTEQLTRATAKLSQLRMMKEHPLSTVQQRMLRDGFVELLARYLMLENEQEEFKQQTVGIRGGKKAFALKVNKLQQFREALDNQSWESVTLISSLVNSALANARKKDAYIAAKKTDQHFELEGKRTYRDVSLDTIERFGNYVVMGGDSSATDFDQMILVQGLNTSLESIAGHQGSIDKELLPKMEKKEKALRTMLFEIGDEKKKVYPESLHEELGQIEQQIEVINSRIKEEGKGSTPKTTKEKIMERRQQQLDLTTLYTEAQQAYLKLSGQHETLREEVCKLLEEIAQTDKTISSIEDDILTKEQKLKDNDTWGIDRLYTDAFSAQERMRTHGMSTELQYFIDSTKGESNKVKYYFPELVVAHAKDVLRESAESKMASKWKEVKAEEKQIKIDEELSMLEERAVIGHHEVLFHALGHEQYCNLTAIKKLNNESRRRIRDHLILNGAIDIPRTHKRIIFNIAKEAGIISRESCSSDIFIEEIKLSASPFQEELMIALAIKVPETFVRLVSAVDPMKLNVHELCAIYEGCRAMPSNPKLHDIEKQCAEYAKYKTVDELMPKQNMEMCLAAGEALNKHILLMNVNNATHSDQTPDCITKIPFDKHKVFDYSNPRMQLLYALSFAQNFIAGAEVGMMHLSASFLEQSTSQHIMQAHNSAKLHMIGLGQQLLVESQPEFKEGKCYQNIYFSASGSPGNCLVNTDSFQPRGAESDWNYKK